MTDKYSLSGQKPEPTDRDRARFRARVDTETDPGGCHGWTGSIGNANDPRGKFQAQGIQDYAYRWAVVLTGRFLKEGEVVSHECNNSNCVREDHLVVTDQRANMQHMVLSDRHGSAKLTVDSAERILRQWAAPDRLPQTEIARSHGLSPSTISKLVNGRTWRSIRKKQRSASGKEAPSSGRLRRPG